MPSNPCRVLARGEGRALAQGDTATGWARTGAYPFVAHQLPYRDGGRGHSGRGNGGRRRVPGAAKGRGQMIVPTHPSRPLP